MLLDQRGAHGGLILTFHRNDHRRGDDGLGRPDFGAVDWITGRPGGKPGPSKDRPINGAVEIKALADNHSGKEGVGEDHALF